jgi:DNA-binding winged helix-turn-helix (wHTH) protein
MPLAFGACIFDSEARVLLRARKPVHLSPKAFRLLELLLEQRPRVLAKKEIVARLWPDTFVTDGSLANLVSEVRTATGDTANQPRYIRTVHRVGYAFCGEATEVPLLALQPVPPARFRLVSSEREFALGEGEWLIGRAADCQVCLHNSSVSRNHARLRIADREAVLEDLDSKNGTFVWGRRIVSPTILANGDRVQFGSVDATLRVSDPLSSTARLVPQTKG